MECLKIAVVTPKALHGEKGGAENFYAGLVSALNRAGHIAHQIDVLIDESTFEGILEAYCRCFDLDLDDYDVVISTKSPTYMVRHRNHISYLVHTMRAFYDMFESEFDAQNKELQKKRRIIHAFDKYGLDPIRVKKHFAIGKPVCERLTAVDPFWKDIPFEILYPPPIIERFPPPKKGEFIFLPSRIHKWKRQDLVIKAMEHVTTEVRLVICGTGEYEGASHSLARSDDRIEFLGPVDDDTLVDLYSRSIVVPFVPIGEDYGYITIEAFLSRKPVITCFDSGEPANIVRDGFSGFVVAPDPRIIADRIDYLVRNPEEAARMGENGYQSIQGISWDSVVERLLGDIEVTPNRRVVSPITVLVLDMQPIEPATGGGRLRLKGLYSHLGEEIHARYIGTFDWRGENEREIAITESLEEWDIPLHEDQFKLNDYFSTLLSGRTLIDLLFPLLGEASPDLMRGARENAKGAEVIIFSHPWMYPLIKTHVDLSKKTIIYDSHNCEGILRQQLLGNTPFAKCISNFIRFVERELCEEADLVLACSEEDKFQFVQEYHIDPEKIEVVPNGVDIHAIVPVTTEIKKRRRDELELPDKIALFIGSEYPPNVEGGQFIIDTLADQCPDVTFVLVGGVGNQLNARGKKNVRICGLVSDEKKRMLLEASDIAINPMFRGSGTNIKMFDFLSAGLPTITSPIGARGIRDNGSFIVAEPARFSDEMYRVLSTPTLYQELAMKGRSLVADHYDWNKISHDLGRKIRLLHKSREPYFSVIVPTKRGNLDVLIEALNNQRCRDFEAIIIDAGENREASLQEKCTFPVVYINDTSAGAVRARNIGIAHATGRIIAFTDDDCRPDAEWLENAKRMLESRDIIGIEGDIYSDNEKREDARYRIVTNEGFHGLGFMTANLFLRRDVIERIAGFDERFDKPHFREDTDLAWRAQHYGEIPFSDKVRVYHPPHLRNENGESKQERDQFFKNDPLLFSKHPEKYLRLIKAEGHYRNNTNFWRMFREGCKRISGPVPIHYLVNDPDIRKFIPSELISEQEKSAEL